MANPFLTEKHDEIETAIMLEKAYITDIGTAVAYTDGDRVFINTEDNLTAIMPAYSLGMLKWLLWHERCHMDLKHHNRFFKYVGGLTDEEAVDKLGLTHKEVNIIMDILVHDSLAKMFPELVDTALTNLAQMRNRNSLGYTFTTFTLEEMLDEYKDYKKSKEEEGDEEGDDEESKEGDSDEKAEDTKPSKSKTKKGSDSPTTPPPPPPEEDDKEEESKEEGDEEEKDDEEEKTGKLPDEHDKTDWSKLEDIDDKEFIEKSEADKYIAQINELKRTKFRLTQITQMLNGLATTTRQRTYAMPSMIQIDERTMLKGRKPGKTSLYLIFDASGSMGEELATFKEIISKSIPQAMNCPCEWFSGYPGTAPVSSIRYNKRYLDRTYSDYYKGKFKDIMPIRASGGYDDDGDRTLELCYLAEQAGYTPIGVTDGGGCVIDHDQTIEQIKKLKRTVLVGQNERWFNKVKSINPGIRTICL